ncbi:MAG: hypothetical protein ACOWWR_16000 [Eubacteriales bacterium]
MIEMLISILLILLIFTAILISFQFGQKAYQSVYQKTTVEDNIRTLSIILERQILSSDKIYIVKDIFYLRDMETSTYFNYYYCSEGMLYKVKTNEQLERIGVGSTSQMAADIDEIQMISSGNDTLTLYLEYAIDGESYTLMKDIPYGGILIIIQNN